jgi:hypothetical protein
MRRALVVVLMLAVVVAGCGGANTGGKMSPKQAYARQLADAGKPLQDAFADADQTNAKISTAQIIGHLEQQATAVESAIKKFRAITPPAGLESTHRKILEGLQQLADSFRKGAEAARRHDTKSLATALRKLPTSDGVKKLTEAQGELKAQGVTVTNASSG